MTADEELMHSGSRVLVVRSTETITIKDSTQERARKTDKALVYWRRQMTNVRFACVFVDTVIMIPMIQRMLAKRHAQEANI